MLQQYEMNLHLAGQTKLKLLQKIFSFSLHNINQYTELESKLHTLKQTEQPTHFNQKNILFGWNQIGQTIWTPP